MRQHSVQHSVLAAALALLALATPAAAGTSAPWLDGLIGVEPLAPAVEEAWARLAAAAFLDPTPPEIPASLTADAEPRMIFVSVSDGEGSARVLRGAGEGAAQALRELLDQRSEELRATAKWVKVDVVRDVVHRADPDLGQPFALPRGLWGLAFERDVGLAFLPEQLVVHTLVDSDQRLRLENLGKQPGTARAVARLEGAFKAGAIPLYRFSTASYFLEDGALVPLYRGHRTFERLTPELLLESARRAGDYLTRVVGADGRFAYSYLPKTDREKRKYNILRHAGTTYSLLELFEVTGDRELMAAAERAIGYLRRAVEPCTAGDANAACVVEDDAVKLGGNALAIVALAKHAEVTGSRQNRPLIERLGRWILAVQNETGEFTVHKRTHSTAETVDFTSQYYPGEALLALLRGGGEGWADAAERGARWLIEVRDAQVPIARLNHDHWLLYALNDLYRRRPNPLYLEHASRITAAIVGRQNRRPSHPDWLGSYYRPPRSTPTATRSEGLAAAYLLQRDHGDAGALPGLLEALELGVRFQLQTQFAPESVLYLRDPRRALGGFHRSLTDYEIRIDYVQHNVSSLLLLRRILMEAAAGPPASQNP